MVRFSRLIILSGILLFWLNASFLIANVDCSEVVERYIDSADGFHPSDTLALPYLRAAERCIAELDDDSLTAELYFRIGRSLSGSGSLSEAHDYLIRAMSVYSSLGGDWAASRYSVCLYLMATTHLNQSDTAAMRKIVDEMAAFAAGHYDNISVQYDYHSVLQAYHSVIFSHTGRREDIELSMSAAKRAIYYQSQMTRDEWVKYKINPIWVYYNVAVCYDLYYTPMPLDSIEKYIGLAYIALEKWKPIRADSLEVSVSLDDERAWLAYYRKDYESAIAIMDGVLDMLSEVERLSANTVVTERGEVYSFLVEVYGAMGDYRRALEYQQLLEENNARRFDAEKSRAIHEVEVKYEVEKKERDMQHLSEQNATMRRIVVWTAVAAVLLFFVLLLVVVVLRQRHIVAEQRHYEAALEADNRREAKSMDVQKYIDRLKMDFPAYGALFDSVNTDYLNSVMNGATVPLTAMDMRYIICFLSGLKPVQIAAMMNVEPASVYTVRYRLKKKVGDVL